MNMEHVLTFDNWKMIQESEGILYSPGERLNEGLSDFFHTVADWSSIAADLIIPGSGAIIDLINAIGYFLEAGLLKNETESSAAALSGFIALGSMGLPYALQGIATAVKGALKEVVLFVTKGAEKYGKSKTVGKAAMTIWNFIQGLIQKLSTIGNSIVSKVKEFFTTKVGSFIKSKFGGIGKFTTWINGFFDKAKGWLQRLNDKIKTVFPSATGVNPSLPKNIVINKAKADRNQMISTQILSRINDGTSKFTGKPLGGTALPSKSKTTDWRDEFTSGGYGEKPKDWWKILVKMNEKYKETKQVTYSNAQGVLVPSGPSSDRIYLNRRYFQFPKGKAGKVPPVSKGHWKFSKITKSKDFPTGLNLIHSPDKK